jgi:pilus assembly protein Flp/PilA
VVTLFQSLYTLSVVTTGRVSDRVQTLKNDERGASAVEYALLVGLIAIAVVAAVTVFGGKLKELFDGVNVNPKAATPVTAPAAG